MNVFDNMFNGMVAESKPESRVSVIGNRLEEIIIKQKEFGKVTQEEIDEFIALTDEVKILLDIN